MWVVVPPIGRELWLGSPSGTYHHPIWLLHCFHHIASIKMIGAPATVVTAPQISSIWFQIHTMANSPDQNPYSYSAAPSPERHGGATAPARSNRLEVPEKTPSRASSPTQYEFILNTGDESATTARQKLKTVRSHVMKNYLQQQSRQGRGPGESSLSAAQSERRKGKERARSSRSTSREHEQNPTPPNRERSSSVEIGALFSGFSLADPFSDHGRDQHSLLGK